MAGASRNLPFTKEEQEKHLRNVRFYNETNPEKAGA